MDYELELTKANRLKLAKAFSAHPRVDYSIDCVLEGQMGKAFVDHLEQPTAYRITIGPFWYFAGDARSAGGYEMMANFPAYNLFMPSPADWLDVAREVFGPQLKPFPRYRFSAEALSIPHLEQMLEQSPYRERIIPLNEQLVNKVAGQEESYLDVSDFDSVSDFVGRGMGFTILDNDRVMGMAYSSLVCSRGIEVSVFIEDAYRQQGVATALSAKLLLECLKLNLRPNWDAANPESCKLAEKLGFRAAGTYDSYYHTVQKSS